jgi:hypothetical protein
MKIKEENVGGKWFTVYMQEWGQDCGPTCVAMCIKRLKGSGSEIDALRKQTNRPMVSPAIQRAIDALPNAYTSKDVGTHVGDLVKLANKNGLRATSAYVNSMAVLKAFSSISHNKIYIAHISWTAGGGHFVVVAGASESGNPIILDPYFGAQVANLCPSYTPMMNSDGEQGVGRFSGHIIEVIKSFTT